MGARIKVEGATQSSELKKGRKLWHDFNKKCSAKSEKSVNKTVHFHKYVKSLSVDDREDLKAWLKYKLQVLDDYYLGCSTTEKEERVYEIKAQLYKSYLGEL